MNKVKRKNYTILCYIGLVILIILLLLPPGLRMFGKNLYVKEEKKNDSIMVLTCNKQNETINSTFLNDVPQNIEYKIKGNFTIKKEETDGLENDGKTDNVNSLMDLIRPYSQIMYLEKDDITSFSVSVNSLKILSNYNELFGTLDKQKTYFGTQSFFCETVKY